MNRDGRLNWSRDGSALGAPPSRVGAWILDRAIARALASTTLQEGLFDAYRCELRWLRAADELPVHVRATASSVVGELRDKLGLHPVTGEKIAPSILRQGDAEALLQRLSLIRCLIGPGSTT